MIWLLSILAGCTTGTVKSNPICDAMCAELVDTCKYAAYPTSQSCVQGCVYNQKQGADIAGQRDCILDAQCDTFDIVECEHQFGPEPGSTDE